MSGYTEIALLQYELEKLRAELAKKDAKIERIKTVPMMYRRMAFNAQLQDENNELRQQVAEKDEVIAEAGEMLAMRDRQLAALKTELREICAAIDDPACDLTLTAIECIKKLKGKNEWQPIETAPKDGTRILGWCAEFGARETKMNFYGEGSIGHANWKSGKGPRESGWDWTEPKNGWGLNWNPTHWMPLPKPPAMAQGEQGC